MQRKLSSSKTLKIGHRSGQSKSLRTRKDNSISPLTKQIFINKQNIPPHHQNREASIDTPCPKNKYSNIKTQKQILHPQSHSIHGVQSSASHGNHPFQGNHTSQGIHSSLGNHLSQGNNYSQGNHLSQGMQLPPPSKGLQPPKQITIKLPHFSSLEKCSLNHKNNCSPSSLYYVREGKKQEMLGQLLGKSQGGFEEDKRNACYQKTNKKCDFSGRNQKKNTQKVNKNNDLIEKNHQFPQNESFENNQFICCQKCSEGYSFKIPIGKIGQHFIKGDLTVRDYFRILEDKIDTLEQARKNLEEYQSKYASMASQQIQNHRKYYNSILEIIEKSMRNSETLLAVAINYGEKILADKKQQIHEQLHFAHNQMQKLVYFQQNCLSPQQNSMNIYDFDIQRAQQRNFEIHLPVISIFANMEQKQKQFSLDFIENFSLQPLISPLTADSVQQRQASPYNTLNLIQTQEKETSRFGNENENIVQNSNTDDQIDDIDLYCQQSLQKGMKKGHKIAGLYGNFPKSYYCPENQCIVELVDEENAISPVFKIM